jgi:hypothetical protein
VLIRLNAHDPHPELRTAFKHPGMFPWLHENRAKYIHALLTIARAWLAAHDRRGFRPAARRYEIVMENDLIEG